MKTNSVMITMLLAGAAFTTMPLRAEEPGGGMKCACMKEMQQKMDAKMKAEMESKMKSESGELDKLVDAMNSSTGDKKIEAMAAAINKMVQMHKGMESKMAAMRATPAEPAKPSQPAKPAAPGEAAPKPADPHAEHQH